MDDNTTDGATGRGDNLVADEDGCPICGERDADRLVIDPQTEEHVDCTSCGHRYELGGGTGWQRGEPSPGRRGNIQHGGADGTKGANSAADS